MSNDGSRVVDNSLLVACALVRRTLELIRGDSRQQLDRVTLFNISENLKKASLKCIAAEINDLTIIGPMQAVSELIDTLLKEEAYVETDVDTKQLMQARLDEAYILLKIAVGKFYMTNNFNYSRQLNSILNDIIETCIANQFYFGLESQV